MLFSYFYDIAFDVGLIVNDNDDHSSTITTIPIRHQQKHPFLCFDLTYIYSGLTKGYRLSEDIQIHILIIFVHGVMWEKRRLEKALSQIDTSNINVSISWYPFELDPNLPSDGSL
ncbi:unnamed protein product [Rotaria sordida]|uniref:Uncharacterized protein n=1 Tax=Rotaria sordida TaxID=392033 RepID=A0A815ZPU6_9BILA|nr:unnamed protein product [Rotaria sordida]CAF1587581.1 unnamed protein product [Rotaria sordida]